MKLAYEITKINHGEKLAQAAQDNFVRTIQNKEIPKNIPQWTVKKSAYPLVELLVEAGLAASKSEARRLVEQGAIKLKEQDNFVVVKDAQKVVNIKSGLVISRGKLHFIEVISK
jgi:tyrosyl-tRNA synthetase